MRITLAVVVLSLAGACADPEGPDASASDVGFLDGGIADSGVRPDATPDSGPADGGGDPDAASSDAGADASSDASAFSLALTASSTTVVDTAPLVLTATPMSGTSTIVAFYEGTSFLGTAVPPEPFTFSIGFNASMNGLHALHAEATSGGNRAVSNEVTVQVRIESALYVDPVGGDDADLGTLAAPLKTISQALSLAQAGTTIWLFDGTYEEANQEPGFGTNCPGPALPTGVNLRAINPDLVTLIGIDGCALRVEGSSRIEGIHFYGYQQALTFYEGSSVVTASDFEDCGMAMYLNDTAEVLLEGTAGSLIRDIQNLAFGVPGATVDDDARLTVRGALFEDITSFNIGVFLARGAGTLVLENSAFRAINRPAFRVYDNAHAIVRDTTFDGVGGSGLAAENATILIGGNNTQTPADLGVTLERCVMMNNHRHGISITYYSNTSTHLGVSLIDSRIEGGLGTAILNNGLTVADPGLNVDVRLVNSVLQGGAGGILSVIANIDIQGGEISGMSGPGIEITNSSVANLLRVRGATFAGNGDDGIRISSTTTTLDLGTSASLGNNTMSGIPVNAAAVHLAAPIAATAVGNTWVANEQGADGAGHFPAGTTGTGPAAGRNYELVSGATLLLQ